MNTLTLHKTPWYREPWPWLLMSGPLIVVVAAIFTAWIAYTKGDPLVSEDYYRKGLAAKQTIASSQRADALGLEARLGFTSDRVQLNLSARDAAFRMPPSITLTLSHPTRAGLDQTQRLLLTPSGYQGELRVPKSGHWLIILEDDAQTWRLLGNVVLPDNAAVVIGSNAVADIRNQ